MIMETHRIPAFKCCCCGWYVQITSMHYVHGEPTNIKCGSHAFYLSSMLLGFSIFTTKVRCMCMCVFFSNFPIGFVFGLFVPCLDMNVWSVKKMDTLDLGRFFFSLFLAKICELANFLLSKWLKWFIFLVFWSPNLLTFVFEI